ncbi:MAG: circularly permuted type 2 ATP-grasp protein, partial [Planctomycetota bacterium]|nr:circularly permuted type 2 ATP-grasp protein [Planctomycetota bacterium]
MALTSRTEGTVDDDLLNGYLPPANVFDEMFASPGVVRPHWQRFAEQIKQLGRDELTRRWEQAKRLIRENGVTYNVHGDPQGMDRPWELDAFPVLLPSSEWQALSDSLVQRARLLNLTLLDIYGSQHLMTEGILPPELVFANPGFLRSCHGWPVPKNCFLHLYAAHLARSSNGQWSVLADRTQAPSGAGYAVENRIVISRMMPQIYSNCEVQRIASFFLAVRETMSGLSPRSSTAPRIVLLSPGPKNPAYFEDAYLARYLGYTLV